MESTLGPLRSLRTSEIWRCGDVWTINVFGYQITITLGGLLLIVAYILQSLLMFYSYVMLQHKIAELNALMQMLGGI